MFKFLHKEIRDRGKCSSEYVKEICSTFNDPAKSPLSNTRKAIDIIKGENINNG